MIIEEVLEVLLEVLVFIEVNTLQMKQINTEKTN